jgi:hypothetical protein
VRPVCAACSRRISQCSYDTVTAEETRSNALKRKYDEIQQTKDIYKELFVMLQSRSKQDALDILHRLRTGADVEGIVKHIRDGDLLVQLSLAPDTEFRYEFPAGFGVPSHFLSDSTNPYLSSFLYDAVWNTSPSTNMAHVGDFNRSREPSYSVPYHAASHVDVRISKIYPSKWTSVSTDDDLMRKLLHIYFASEYTSFPFFHKDHFLNDMAAGGQQFCSPLLVNTILALAWVSRFLLIFLGELWLSLNIAWI